LATKHIPDIRYALDRLYQRYNHFEFVAPDPLQFVYRYSSPADMEIVAFLASALAYGRVRHIEKSLTDLFERMGASPYEFVVTFDQRKRRIFRTFRHRFTSGQDIADLIAIFQIVFDHYRSIETFFLLDYDPDDRNVVPALSRFCRRLLNLHVTENNGAVSRGLKFLLADPAGGSACKRLNLFLRWMVRNDAVDTGLWTSIEPAKLVVPIDVHMARLCKILRFYDQKSVSLSTAASITERFAQIEPDDPVKYDFALSRIGIVENCDGRLRRQCEKCELSDFCHYGMMCSNVFAKTG